MKHNAISFKYNSVLKNVICIASFPNFPYFIPNITHCFANMTRLRTFTAFLIWMTRKLNNAVHTLELKR